MHTRQAWLLVPLIALSCAHGPEAPPVDAIGHEQAVRQITHLETVEWARASREGDVDWFKRHLADELMLTTGRTGKLTTKADELASVRASSGNGGSDKIDDLKVHVYGHVAVATFKIDTTGTDDTGPYHRIARYTEVWVHRDGRWQLAASHSSLLPAASPH